MELRHDALVGASSVVTKVREVGRCVEGLRATVGRFSVLPNASNVIPSQVDFSLDIRHPVDRVRLEAVASIVDYARSVAEQDRLKFEILSELHTSSVQASPTLVEAMEQAVQECGHRSIKLPSGAGHDAMIMASRFRWPCCLSVTPKVSVTIPTNESNWPTSKSPLTCCWRPFDNWPREEFRS